VKPTTSEAVFGGFDGATSLVGFLAGALVVRASAHTVLVEAAALAVASAVSMAAGDYLAGKPTRLAAVMGFATLAGSLAPALPVVLIHGWVGVALGVLLVLLLGLGIAELRARGTRPSTATSTTGRGNAYLSTFAVLILASVFAAGVSLLLGVSG
jgi:hypothetical protein